MKSVERKPICQYPQPPLPALPQYQYKALGLKCSVGLVPAIIKSIWTVSNRKLMGQQKSAA